MDNNLVNIDDLVRQRLGGAEEREPSGAWLRMRELLDEKEDRKPVGFIWRRMFGGLAILALLASISLGGYQLTSHYRSIGSGNRTEIAMVTPVRNSSSAHTGANKDNNISQPDNNLTNSDHNQNTSIAGKNKPSNNNLIKKHNTLSGDKIVAANPANHNNTHHRNNLQINRNPVVAASGSDASLPVKVAENNNATPADNTGIAKNIRGNQNPISGSKMTRDAVDETFDETNAGTPKPHKLAESGTSQQQHNKISNYNTGVKTTKSQQLTTSANTHQPHNTNLMGNNGSGSTKSQQLSASADTHQPDNSSMKGLTGTGTTKSQQLSASADTHQPHNNSIKGKTGAATTKPNKLTASVNTNQLKDNLFKNKTPEQKSTTATKSENNKSGNGTASKTGTEKQKGTYRNTHLPKESSLVAKVVKHTAKVTDYSVSEADDITTDSDEEVAVNKMPVGSSHPIGADSRKKQPVKSTITSGSNKNSGTDKKLAATVSAAHAKSTRPTPAANDYKLDGKKLPVAGSGHIPATVPGDNEEENNELKNKESLKTRMANKIIPQIVLQERIVKTGPHTYDTYFDTISIGSINQVFAVNDNTSVYGPPTVRQFMEKNSTASNSGNQLIVPGASTEWADEEAATKPAEKLAKHEKSKSKGGGGPAATLEKAINDIKYSLSGARFAAGLKGGINGTFFGPNNFKGFQMGVTGNFILSEKVNILAELQYFQRINSGFIMNDDYYTYTQIGYNLWSRQQIQNPFSFSTLHSFELPLILRYTVNNFNFFAGGNMVYTLAINESQGLPAPGAVTQVAAQGNDTKPTIKENDFNGRFGLGYLFGTSVQLSPVISLDIRDVQTLWDNAATSGSKAVSTHLFRSPSFQLSLGYRFGGKKAKQKE